MARCGGVGDDTDPVLQPASRHPHVEMLGGRRRVGHEDGPVDGDALGLVDRQGVGQRDVLGRVGGWKDDPTGGVEARDDQGAVLLAGVDAPAVAVADPQAVRGDEPTVVAGRDHLVALADRLDPNRDPVRFDLPRGNPLGPRPQRQRVDRGVIRREHDDGLACGPSSPPRRVGVVEHPLPRPAADAPVGGVVAEDGVVPLAEPKAGRRFPRGDEPVDVVKFGSATVGDEEAEEAAGLDGAKLTVIADEDQLGIGRLHGFDQAGEIRGGHHRRLVEDDDFARAEPA
jgi:hypothetical protein